MAITLIIKNFGCFQTINQTQFLYCKPIKKRKNTDDQLAFYLNELENIKSSYNYASVII